MTRRPSRRPRVALLAVLLALVSGVAFLRTRFAADTACTLARRNLPRLLGMDVGIDRCELDPLSMQVTLKGLALTRQGAAAPFFTADEAEVALRSVRVLSAGVDLESLKLVRPRLRWEEATSAPVTKSRPQGSATCSADSLRRVSIRRLDISGAELDVTLAKDRQLSLSGVDLSWKVRRGVAELKGGADSGRVRLGTLDLPIAGAAVEGGLDQRALSLELSRGEVTVDQATLNLVGRVAGFCTPVMDADVQAFLPLSTLSRFAPLGDVAGHVWVRAQAKGAQGEQRYAAEVVGTQVRIRQFEPGDFHARLSATAGEVRLDDLVLKAGGGTARVDGTARLLPGIPLKAHVETNGAELGHILERVGIEGPWVNLAATGKVNLAGHLTPSFQLAGEADLKVDQFALTSRPFDAPSPKAAEILAFPHAHVTTGVRILSDRVDLHDARVELEHSHVETDVTLFYDTLRGLSIHASAEPLSLADTGRLLGIRWSGAGAVRASIQGPYASPHIEGELSLRDLLYWDLALGVVQGKLEYADRALFFSSVTGQKGRTLYSGSGEIRFLSDKEGGPRVRGQAFATNARTEDLVDLIAPLHPSISVFQGWLTGDADAVILADSPLTGFDGVLKLNLRNTAYAGRRLGDGGAVIKFDRAGSMAVQAARLDGPLGTFSGQGSFLYDGLLDFKFRGEDVSLAEAFGVDRAQRWGLGARVTWVGRVEGDATTPVISSYITSPEVRFARKPLGDMQVEARLSGKDLQVWGRPFGGARLNLHGKVKEPYPYDVDVSFALPEIGPLLPEGAVSQGVSGAMAGSFTASGTLTGPKSLKASLALDKLSLSRGDFAGANDGPIQVSYDNGSVSVESFTFRAPNTELSIAGSGGAAALDVSAHGALDMRLLESFVPTLERAQGRIEVNASAKGALNNPTIVGSAFLEDARFGIRDKPLSFRGLSGRLEFSEARVLLEDLHGTFNDGRIAADGDLRLDHLALSDVALRLQLDEVVLRALDDLPVTTTGELMLHGHPGQLLLSGDLDIQKLRYERPIELDALVKQFVRASPLASGGLASGPPPKPWLSFDVGVHAKGDVRIDNNLAKARILGDLRLTGNNLHPGLLGQLETAEGGQVFFRQATFAIEQGLLDFKDKNSIDPNVDLHADAQVRDYRVQVHIYDRLSNPQVGLSSDPALDPGDILSLLTLGVTSRDKSNTALAGAGLAGEALIAATGLDRVIQGFLPKNQVLRDLQFHLGTSYNEGSGVVESTAQLESKFLTDRLTLKASEPVSGKGTKAQAEYRFNHRLSGQLQWDSLDYYYGGFNLGLLLKVQGEVQ